MSKTHWNTIVDAKYISGDEILGTKPILTIKDFRKEEVVGDAGRKENCGVLYWEEPVKPMIANITNVKQIAKLFNSPYKEDWYGQKVQLTTEKVKAFGQLWNALRICKSLPAQQPIICNDCKGTVLAVGEYTAQQVAAMTTKKYGAAVCGSCSDKRKGENNNVTE